MHFYTANNCQWVSRYLDDITIYNLQIFTGTSIISRCEYYFLMYKNELQATQEWNVTVTLGSPTATPQLYNLPTITTTTEKDYETLMSKVQHFLLIDDCNSDDISTRQCELMCQRTLIHKKCAQCYASSLHTQLLGVNVDNDGRNVECTINDYAICNQKTNDTNNELKECLASCLPACSYWKYDLSVLPRDRGSYDQIGTTVIAPIGEYIEFTQSRAYTWFKVIADIGGLMYGFFANEFA